jgi:hypothetical protein
VSEELSRVCKRCKVEKLIEEMLPQTWTCRECKAEECRERRNAARGGPPRKPKKRGPKLCPECGKPKRAKDYYDGELTRCKRCVIGRPWTPPKKQVDRRATVKNGFSLSDRLENTSDMGELAAREQTAYFRGLWVGWKRGIDSHSRMGSGDGNVLVDYLARVLAGVNMPDTLKAEVYAAGRRLKDDLLPVARPPGVAGKSWEGTKEPATPRLEGMAGRG